MKKLYEAGEFTKGDELLNYYTYQGDKKINGVARHTLLLHKPGVKALETEYDEISKNYIISEDLFIKTIIELSEIRKRIAKDGNINKNLWERLITEKYLYRGLPMKDFLKTIQGAKPPKDWLTKEIFEKDLNNQVVNYLKGRISMDPAVLSTSLDENAAIDFINGFPGVLLKIDVTKHNKGLDIHENSPYDEKEILLSPGTKLKITDVVYNSNKDYFKISCVPV